MKALLVSCAVMLLAPFGLSQQGPEKKHAVAPALPGTLSIEEIRAMLEAPNAHVPFVPEAPLGIGGLKDLIPKDNALTPAKVELGRQLFFEGRLSRDGTVSCATCHDPGKGWTDNSPVSVGIDEHEGGRSAPPITNRILGGNQFWDGRAGSLETQALGPIGNPIEMGSSPEAAAKRLNEIPGYRLQFEAVFGFGVPRGDVVDAAWGGPVTPERIAKAIAAFERTILSGANWNDYYEQALPFFDWEPDEEEDPEFLANVVRILQAERKHHMPKAWLRGRELFFGKAKCSSCHVGRDLTDEQFHNVGVGFDGEAPDLGRFKVSGLDEDKGAFKTPSLRNISETAPYMHDGSLASVREVVEHYNRGGNENPWLSGKIFPLQLTEQEKDDLIHFVGCALTGDSTEVEIPRLP